MSDEMDEIRKRNKAKQAELAKVYPSREMVWLPCSTLGCKNRIELAESEWQADKKYFCGECLSRGLAA